MVEKLVYFRTKPIIGKIAFYLLIILGLEVPIKAKIGKNVKFEHGGFGCVIHPGCIIEDNVRIYQGVTIGRADAYSNTSEIEGLVIKEGAVLCAGCKIIGKKGVLTVGKGTVIGANAVLTQSTGDNEIWAGVPARKISDRK